MKRLSRWGALALAFVCALVGVGCSGSAGPLVSDTVTSSAASSSSTSSSSVGSNSTGSLSVSSGLSSSELTSSATSSATSSETPVIPPRLSTMVKKNAFYAPSPADCVYTLDVSGVDGDTVDMLRTLQGLIARYDGGALYLMASDADLFWKNYAANEIGIYFQETTVEKLLTRYADLIGGVILYTPGTFEYETAFDLALYDDCLIATEEVARRFALTSFGRVTDLRNVYADQRAAYADVLKRLPASVEYAYWLGESGAFADYAYAVRAPMFRLAPEERTAWLDAVSLGEESRPFRGVVFLEDEDVPRTAVAEKGVGLLNVKGFGNATFFSSVTTTKKYTPKQSAVTQPGREGETYVTFLLRSQSLGDTVNIDYAVWKAQSGRVPVAYEFPTALSELAPMIVMWYQGASVDSSRLIAGGWCAVEEKSVSYAAYREWHTVNNAMMAACGLDITVTDSLREDAIYGENFGDCSTATGIFVADGSGNGSVWMSKNTPVIVSVSCKSVPAMDLWLSSLTAQKRPCYYVVSMTVSAFSQPYDRLPDEPNGAVTSVTMTEVILSHMEPSDSPLRAVTAEDLIAGGRLTP